MNRLPPLVLSLWLVLLGSGQAQASAWSGPASRPPSRHVRLLNADEPQASPRPRLLADESAPAEEQGVPRTERIFVELGVGAVTGSAVAVAAFYALGGASCSGVLACGSNPFLGAVTGFGVGAVLGVYGAGHWMGGQGHLVGPFVGAVAGTAVGLTLSVLFALGYGASEEILLLVPALSVTGAVIGYEVSQPSPAPRRLRPLLSVSSRGGLVGLAGAF